MLARNNERDICDPYGQGPTKKCHVSMGVWKVGLDRSNPGDDSRTSLGQQTNRCNDEFQRL